MTSEELLWRWDLMKVVPDEYEEERIVEDFEIGIRRCTLLAQSIEDLGFDYVEALSLLQCLEPETLYRILPFDKADIINDFRKKFIKERKNGKNEKR